MNYYKQIAEMLGVELGEEFRIKDCKKNELNTSRYKITQEEGIMYSMDGEKWCRSAILLSIISGNYSIVRLPWKPKFGEQYWNYSVRTNQACCSMFGEFVEDYAIWKSGNCFRTEEEAKTKGKEIMEQIKKEYEEA